MKPTRQDEHALVDLLDVLLADGVVVQADVIVTVADVPLVGINLRAAIAGMTTMREYGFFEDWDEAHRDRADSRGDSVGRPGGSVRPGSDRPERDRPPRPDASDGDDPHT